MRRKKEINQRVGANVQQARERAHYTQEELSELLSITPNHLSAIERGVSGVTLEMLEKLCRLFNVSADTILFGETERNDIPIELAEALAGLGHAQRDRVLQIVKLVLGWNEDVPSQGGE